MYHCSLYHCRDKQGDPDAMASHVLSLQHKQSWLEETTGEYYGTKQELMSAMRRVSPRDENLWGKIVLIRDPTLWRRAREGQLRGKDLVMREEERREKTSQQASRATRRESPSACETETGKRNHEGESEDISSKKRRSYNEYDGVEEVSRSGNFDNWRTQVVKYDRSSGGALESLQREMPGPSAAFSSQSSQEDDVTRLHKAVAAKVMKVLNRYYPGAQEFEGDTKIGSGEEYSKLAESFSHRLRSQIKESYEAYNGSLEGIRLTDDNRLFIRTEVESHFEQVEVIRRRH